MHTCSWVCIRFTAQQLSFCRTEDKFSSQYISFVFLTTFVLQAEKNEQIKSKNVNMPNLLCIAFKVLQYVHLITINIRRVFYNFLISYFLFYPSYHYISIFSASISLRKLNTNFFYTKNDFRNNWWYIFSVVKHPWSSFIRKGIKSYHKEFMSLSIYVYVLRIMYFRQINNSTF